MDEPLFEKEYKIYSEKYDVHGMVKDFGVVIKLIFNYRGKAVEMRLLRGVDTDFEELSKNLIESYIENLAVPNDKRKLQLHYWHLTSKEYVDGTFVFARGNVTGHPRLSDSDYITTSEIRAVFIDKETKEAVLTTRNSVYHCPLAYCNFKGQNKYPNLLPDYEKLKEEFDNSAPLPTIEPGKVLLVLADFCDYYFHSLYYVPEDSKDSKPVAFSGHAHIGMFQDSFLIGAEDTNFDLRFFPHCQNIEFYSGETEGKPLFLENIGQSTIYARTWVGIIKLEPGERKEVKEENIEKDPPRLPNGDLYPAGIL